MNTRKLVWLLAAALAAAERPVPPPGIDVPAEVQAEFEASLAALKQHPRGGDADVRIFHDAVDTALRYKEFLRPEEIPVARRLLEQGQRRAGQLARGESPWNRATGLVVRGYVSRIDDSVQPYGLVVPPNWSPESPRRWRLDAWFHGRNERLTELNFLDDRLTNPGQFTPPDTIVLHLYGRYCNANKFAGEVDLFEALADVRRRYRIDEDRITVRGFSMGGAAVWHIAAHYAGRWAAAAPGAGFAETAEFLNVFQNEVVKPEWWEEKLWRAYDATVYAENFFHLPLVAYSGEQDRQIQAARVMERELAKLGIPMRHVIGPGMGHRYHPDSKVVIDDALNRIVARGRDNYPPLVRFVTYTLRYNRMKWVRVDGLAQHWEKARVEAEISGPSRVRVSTANVTGLTLLFSPGGAPLDVSHAATVVLDGQPVEVPGPRSDRSWMASFRKEGSLWKAGLVTDDAARKRHGLQGPIDDAFMSRFLIVRPSRSAASPRLAGWVDAEMNRAITEWRRHFRGEARVKNDSDVTDDDIRDSNLVLWGDPGSNAVLGRIAGKLPVAWSGGQFSIAGKNYDAAGNAPVLVYPNPLNPRRYVVLNSGFTFREYDYLNNARQISKLPDWAVIDLSVAPDGRWPGKVAAAGFFDEQWR